MGSSEELSELRNILVVEENPRYRRALASLIESLGFHAVTAAGIPDLLQAIAGTAFDLILANLGASGDRHGLMLLEILDSSGVRVPVVLLTGGDHHARPEHRARPWVSLLRKPVTRDELSRMSEIILRAMGPTEQEE